VTEHVTGGTPPVDHTPSMSRTSQPLPAGAAVRLTGSDYTATVIKALACPTCGVPAYRVRRTPGSFPDWPTEAGLFHATDTEPVQSTESADAEDGQAVQEHAVSAPLPSTFAQAQESSPFELARIWGDVMTWPVLDHRTAQHCVQELAVMAALAAWLQRWLPLQVHRAALAGATLDQITAAAGTAPGDVVAMWQQWAQGQTRAGHLPAREHALAARRLGAAGTAG